MCLMASFVYVGMCMYVAPQLSIYRFEQCALKIVLMKGSEGSRVTMTQKPVTNPFVLLIRACSSSCRLFTFIYFNYMSLIALNITPLVSILLTYTSISFRPTLHSPLRVSIMPTAFLNPISDIAEAWFQSQLISF